MLRTTYRQFLTWSEWLEQEWNIPSRSDYYLMQIATEVRRVLSSKPSEIKLEHFILKFKQKVAEAKPTKEALEAKMQASKAAWIAMVGASSKIKQKRANPNGKRN